MPQAKKDSQVLSIIPPATATPSSETPAAEPKLTGLEYLGSQAIIGVPARDLAAGELAGLGLSPEELVQTGSYRARYETETEIK